MSNDLTVTFPGRGLIRLESPSLFGAADNPARGLFLQRVASVPEVLGVAIRAQRVPHAEIRFRPGVGRLESIVARIVKALRGEADPIEGGREPGRWEIQLVRPGRLLLANPAIRRRPPLLRAIARELSATLGVEDYRIVPASGSIRIDYDPAQLLGRDLVAIVEGAVQRCPDPGVMEPVEWHLALATAAVPVAAVGHFAVPALLPAAGVLCALAAVPTFRRAHRTVVRERRLGTEFLDSAVVLGCLGTSLILPGAVFVWCLGVGRTLTNRSGEEARRLLLDGFRKRPALALARRGGALVRMPVDQLRPGDRVVVEAGEVVPIDGRIVSGGALLDGSPLHLETTTIIQRPGAPALASTIAMAGRMELEVEATDEETVAARIGRFLDQAAEWSPSAARQGERIAGLAVLPTAAVAVAGMAAIGPVGALAVLGRDFGTGLRMASPLSWIAAISLAAHSGIVLKDPDALDRIRQIDTVLLDVGDANGRDRSAIASALQAIAIEMIEVPPDVELAGPCRSLRKSGRNTCYLGTRIIGPELAHSVQVAISLRAVEGLDDFAHIVLLDGHPERLLELLAIGRDLDRNLRRAWSLVLLPNLAAVAAVFAAGLSVLGSIAINNLSAVAAMSMAGPGLRRAARLEADRRHHLEVRRTIAARMHLDVAEAPTAAPLASPASAS